jgi:hypothetical protein
VAGELRPGDPAQVGPYRLAGVLGDGGMGRVYLGQSAGGRRVAVKVIRPDLADDPSFRLRFRREVDAARKVTGLYTALVVNADTEGMVPWLATAYVDGPPLSAELARSGPLGPRRLLGLAAGLAEGLAAIHTAGVVHRDLKPANVLLGPDGPVIVDFGISRAAEASTLTAAGMLIGTPGFMAPEQIKDSASAAPASDVFSLGALLCFAATGRRPFGTGPLESIVYHTVHAEPDLSGVPDELRSLVARCLAKDPVLRPTTAQILAEVAGSEPVTVTIPPVGSPPLTPRIAPATPGAASVGAALTGAPEAPVGRRGRRRAPWLAVGTALVAAVAVAIPLLMHKPGTAQGPPGSSGSGTTTSSAPTASGPLRPPITQAQAQQVLAAYTTTNNAANASASDEQIAMAEAGSSLAIDVGINRGKRANGSAGYPAYTPMAASYYIPLEPAAYPHWFAVQVKNARTSDPGTQISAEYLVFTQAAAGAPWLDALEPFIPNSATPPPIALDADGHATAVAASDAGLAESPAAASGATATALDSGTGQLASPSTLADAKELQSLRTALPSGTGLTDRHAATSGPVYGLRTTDGGTLLFYEVTAQLTVTAPAGRTVALNVPGFFSPASPVTHAVLDYQEQFAVVDPARGQGALGPVVADYSGITGQG